MRIYLDLVLFLNFAVNFCLLEATARLTGAVLRHLRLGLGAALGAVYGAACLLPGFGFLGANGWRLVFLGLMTVTAFGLGPGTVRRGGVMLLLSLALGGAALCLRLRSMPMLLGAGIGLALLSRTLLRGALHHAGQLVPASFRLGSRRVELTALRDSGNTLCDPFTGQSVLLAQGDTARGLLGSVDLRDPGRAMEVLAREKPGLRCRLIPYRGIGAQGMLLAVRCDEVTVDGRSQGRYVAFSPGKLSGGGEYQALTGGGQYG